MLRTLCVAVSLWCVARAGEPLKAVHTAAGKPSEGELASFLGAPRFEMAQVFQNERFPNVVVAVDGTVLALWGNQSVRARRSEDGGKTWGPEIVVADPGFQGGGAIVNEKTGDVFAFVEAHHPPASLTIYRSNDHGKTWQAVSAPIAKDVNGHVPSMHMNDHGITLRRGPHAGRLLRPARHYAEGNRRDQWPFHYTTAIYSDDGGKTWKTSAPFPEEGTGEATLAELADGTIYYNSRVHWPEAKRPTRRRSAISTDGGQTWKDWRVLDILPDGRQDRAYGCMGGLTRLPVQGRDVLVFSNLDTARKTRERVTVWASFDGGKTWPVKRLVHDGPSAYSSLTSGRPETPSAGWIYHHFEGGPGGGSQVARFNLSWLLEGESTGDGAVPDWARGL